MVTNRLYHWVCPTIWLRAVDYNCRIHSSRRFVHRSPLLLLVVQFSFNISRASRACCSWYWLQSRWSGEQKAAATEDIYYVHDQPITPQYYWQHGIRIELEKQQIHRNFICLLLFLAGIDRQRDQIIADRLNFIIWLKSNKYQSHFPIWTKIMCKLDLFFFWIKLSVLFCSLMLSYTAYRECIYVGCSH